MLRAKLNVDGTINIISQEYNPETHQHMTITASKLKDSDVLRLVDINDIDIEHVTLRSFFSMMKKYPSLSLLTSLPYEELFDILELESSKPSEEEDISHIEINRFHETRYYKDANNIGFDVNKLNDLGDGPETLSENPCTTNLSGASSQFKASGIHSHAKGNLNSLGLIMADLIDKPVKIGYTYSHIIEFTVYNENDCKRSNYKFIQRKCQPTLIEVLKALLSGLHLSEN